MDPGRIYLIHLMSCLWLWCKPLWPMMLVPREVQANALHKHYFMVYTMQQVVCLYILKNPSGSCLVLGLQLSWDVTLPKFYGNFVFYYTKPPQPAPCLSLQFPRGRTCWKFLKVKVKHYSLYETCYTVNLILCLCFLLRSGEEQSPPAICRQHIFRCVVWLQRLQRYSKALHFLLLRVINWNFVSAAAFFFLQVAISPQSAWTLRSGRWKLTGRRWSYRSGIQQGRSASALLPPRKYTRTLSRVKHVIFTLPVESETKKGSLRSWD